MKKVEGLYTIIDTTYVTLDNIEKAAVDIIKGGARVLQLRAKGLGGGDTLKAAIMLRGLTLESNVTFIVNDRVDVAMISRADGVHLGQDDIPLKEARRLLGDSSIIGISTHNPDEAALAESTGADYISFGPIFPTRTKKDARPPRGVEALKVIRERVALPVVAIGGITEEALPDVLKAGADAVAMISEILLDKDIPARVASIISRIKAQG